ncbi:MAG TPA: alanine--tRNA ligase [Candidatus Nanoarchaeia archaeon]|nr:alanine--tRNA ligase [Candidatus Nanoarchaeia archaeon]
MDDKQFKLKFKRDAQKAPEKHYPVKTLKDLNFARKQCTTCKNFFWTTEKRSICGDSSCAGGFQFVNNSPAKKRLDYIETWQQFAKIHKSLGYTPINRYPVVSRWNPTTDYTIASIAAFQPFVVSGEIAPPANPLVIPQFCVRFNDIDNVGITGAHYTGFVMMGQHAFVAPKEYNVNKYLNDHLTWLNKGMGLSNNNITIHEDAWAGGGNFGPSVEFFSAGLELSNQVYMQYERTPSGIKELGIKVLDMGQGHERVPWFTQGETTSYETTFPTVMQFLRKKTGITVDSDLMKRFLPYAAWLNIDEIADIDKAWQKVADKINIPVKELKQNIQQQAALYSIAEHTRALLFTLNDGALPSNVGGGYNLRVIYRRAQDFIQQYRWNIHLPELCTLHAQFLKPLFPELRSHLDDIAKILDVEKTKYEATRQKAHSIISSIVKSKITDETLLKLYDSNGISPELVREEAEKSHIKIKIPDNFYARVAALHEKQKQVHETSKETMLPLDYVPETKALYFDDWQPPAQFTARAIKIIGSAVILDKTWFYPTSGGQLHDIGSIGSYAVTEVFKQGSIIVHQLHSKPGFKEDDTVICTIDIQRRKQLAQHHTSTHIINAAARKVLGHHINQASARKTMEKGSIDITHFARLTEQEILSIEKEAQSIIKKAIPVKKSFMPREEAEKKFTSSIYQGGVAPGKLLRIVEIKDTDVEACGGTHLNNTKEAELIHIINSTKVADDVVRIEFVAGSAARDWESTMKQRSDEIQSVVSGLAKVKITPHSMQQAADIFSVSIEQLKDTLVKFTAKVKENESTLSTKPKQFKSSLDLFASELFDYWKEQNKKIAEQNEKSAQEQLKTIKEKSVLQIPATMQVLRDIASNLNHVLLIDSAGSFVFKGSDEQFKELIAKFGAKGGGTGIRQGKVENVQRVLKNFRF